MNSASVQSDGRSVSIRSIHTTQCRTAIDIAIDRCAIDSDSDITRGCGIVTKATAEDTACERCVRGAEGTAVDC